MGSKLRLSILSLFLGFTFAKEVKAHIPFVETLPDHPQYYQYYYKQLYQWFNKNHFDWSSYLPEPVQLPWQTYKSWGSHHRPHLLLGVGYKRSGEIFYSLTINLKERVTYRSDIPAKSYCHENSQQRTCGGVSFKRITASEDKKKLPLHRSESLSSFVFSDFITYQEIWRSSDGQLITYRKLNDIQTSWLPLPLQKAILDIGIQTRLPVDKIEVNSNDEIIIYYP